MHRPVADYGLDLPLYSLAYADIYHCIAAIITRFDLQILDTLRSRDIDMVRDHFVAKPTRGSKSLRVKIVRDIGPGEVSQEEAPTG